MTGTILISSIRRQGNRDHSLLGWERARIRQVPAVQPLLLGLVLQQPAKARVDADNMTLWDLLIAFCFAMPIAGALASAKLAKAGFSGYALAITSGLALGACFVWTIWTAGNTVDAYIKRQPVSLRERYIRALYFGAILWLVFGLFFGSWVTSVLIKLVF